MNESLCLQREDSRLRWASGLIALREGALILNTRHDLREHTDFRVLHLLQNNPEMSQRELAKAVGVSVGGIHYVLRALVDKGLVKLGNFTAAQDKRRYAYILTPKGITRKAHLTRDFLAKKLKEYEALREEIMALQRDLMLGENE